MSSAIAASVGGAVVGGLISKSGSKSSGSATTTNQQTLDPRMQSLLYGTGKTLRPGVAATYAPSTAAYTDYGNTTGNSLFDALRDRSGDGFGSNTGTYHPAVAGAQNNPESDYTNDAGLLGNISALQNQPRAPGMTQFGNEMDVYLSQYGRPQFDNNMRAASALEGSNINAPQMTASSSDAAQIDAPNQNDTDLAPAYQQMIYGDSAQNPYLTGAIQKGINQSNAAFGNMLTDQTKATQDLLGNIRGGAMMAGGYGGSRQGIAEGKALDSFSTNMSRAASQFGQNNTDSAVSAQAGAFDNGQNRALSAMSWLGAQQYGVATNNAQFQQQTNLQNAQLAQQASMQNAHMQGQTNQLNSANQATGIGLSTGLLNDAYTYGGNNDAYGLNKTSQISGMLAPYAGMGGGSTQSQPLYSNTAGNVLGGATAGLGLYSAYNNATNNNTTGGYNSEMARLNLQAGAGG